MHQHVLFRVRLQNLLQLTGNIFIVMNSRKMKLTLAAALRPEVCGSIEPAK